MPNKYKAVIFDIDGTLTTTNSWVDITKALGADSTKHDQIYLARKSGALNLEDSRKLLLELWQNTQNANETFLRTSFKKTELRPEAKKLFTHLHQKGYTTCLITGSNNLFAQEIANKLGTKYYFANAQFEFDDSGNLTGYDYEIDQGSKKLEQLQDFCAKQKIKLEDCIAVGDGANDIEMMKNVGLPIAIKTESEDQEIEKYTKQTIKNLDELNSFL